MLWFLCMCILIHILNLDDNKLKQWNDCKINKSLNVSICKVFLSITYLVFWVIAWSLLIFTDVCLKEKKKQEMFYFLTNEKSLNRSFKYVNLNKIIIKTLVIKAFIFLQLLFFWVSSYIFYLILIVQIA